jgi:hypothetical protein
MTMTMTMTMTMAMAMVMTMVVGWTKCQELCSSQLTCRHHQHHHHHHRRDFGDCDCPYHFHFCKPGIQHRAVRLCQEKSFLKQNKTRFQ